MKNTWSSDLHLLLWNSIGEGAAQHVWRRILESMPNPTYRRSLTAIKWQALKLAGHRKATTVFPLAHTLLEVCEYAYRFPPELAARLVTARRAIVLVGKAFYCETRGDVRRLATLAHDLYPDLRAAFEGLGGDAPNFRVHSPPTFCTGGLARRGRIC